MSSSSLREKISLSLSLSRATGQVKSKKAFTLVELMIVIAIIGVLAASLFPMISGYMAKARDTKTIAQARELGNALEVRFQDKGDGRVFGGASGSGYGYFDYRGSGYPKSGIEILEEDGYISKGRIPTVTVNDPPIAGFGGVPASRFFYNACQGETTFSMFARLVYPKQYQLIDAAYGCGGITSPHYASSWQAYRRYGYNFAYTFGVPCIQSINNSGTGTFYNCQGMDISDDLYNHVLQHKQPFLGIGAGAVW